MAIWFVYYLGNYGWVTLAPTLLVAKDYSLAHSLSFMLISGIGFVVGAVAPAMVLAAHHHWGFAGALYVMALSGLITALLLPLGRRTTGRTLERIAP